MKKRLIFWIKFAILAAVLGFIGYKMYQAWGDASAKLAHRHVAWRYGIIAVLGFSGSMLTSALTWRWIAWNMGDRSPGVRMLGAYTFSQMGKYIPGKVALLLMRIERAARFGMSPAVCTLSTLLENALYMISGGLVGMIAIAHIADGLPRGGAARALLWPVTIAAVALLASACYPPIFYGCVNFLLRRMKKPPVEKARRLRMITLALGVIAFIPCWLFGGIALWASACCLQFVPLAGSAWFAGAFSLSVIIGMASLFPGGGGVREAVLTAALTLAFAPLMNHDEALLLAGIVSLLQRLFQVIVEVLLGLAGAAITSFGKARAPAATQARDS